MSKSLIIAAGISMLFGCSASREVLGTYGNTDAGPDLSAPNDGASFDVSPCVLGCSLDGRSVIDSCRGTEVECAANETCNDGKCLDACGLAEAGKSSVGCDYYAVSMDIHPEVRGSCFVALVTNTFTSAAHVGASFHDVAIDMAKHAAIPHGNGATIEYEAYDPKKGIDPGQVLIVFLEQFGGVRCPIAPARTTGGSINGSGFGQAFRVTSDVPVVAYQMLPYGGGSAAVTGASLLLPTSAWGTNYVAATAWPDGTPSLDIVAAQEGTTVSILPKVDIVGREGLLEGAIAGVTAKYVLGKGEVLQLTQTGDLTGSPIEADGKIALFAGHPCMNVPAGVGYCDHGEQQIPPVSALGNEYVAAPHRPRIDGDVTRRWRLVGVVDDTKLTFDPPGPYPSSLKLGDAVEITSESAFVVKSQDAAHPFLLFSYMTGANLAGGYGDPDFVRMVSPAQYLDHYVFLTDPSYPETSLVVVRKKTDGGFADVELDCAGKLGSWTPIGSGGVYEKTVVDLVRHDFEPQGKCDNGVHRMSSSAPFGVWVWGWGGPETSGGSCEPLGSGMPPPGTFTCDVSYGFPAGESVRSINDVVVPSRPR